MKRGLLVIAAGLLFGGCILQPKQTNYLNMNQNVTTSPQISNSPTTTEVKAAARKAILKTNMGDITVEFFADKAPVTVANFAALAEGTVDWIDPRDGSKHTNTAYYKNIIFHRVIKDFMIQGGDITGTGRGGPGYQFKDEFDSGLIFDQPGILAMANSGPATNGSQFFITTVATPWLNGKHTIFGKVVSGMEVVSKIENTPTGPGDKPTTDVVLKEVIIER